jgi:ubiquinone/menaquinone biosynthesis C-methylase UbiE
VVEYEDLAAEYYDPFRHPTSANFREGSSQILADWLSPLPEDARVCEVGAGDSIVAAVLAAAGRTLERLLITDNSPKMLSYSSRWKALGARTALAGATDLPVDAGEVDVLVASLGDPYNTSSFWVEAKRVLSPGGSCFYTTPSNQWALALRRESGLESWAVFETVSSESVRVPSLVFDEPQQRGLIENAGLKAYDVCHFSRSSLRHSPVISPKLLVLPDPEEPIVTGYAARRPLG